MYIDGKLNINDTDITNQLNHFLSDIGCDMAGNIVIPVDHVSMLVDNTKHNVP